MRKSGWWVLAGLLLIAAAATAGPAGELKPADVSNPKGDGPDGQGNTADDTWQFWFQLIHDRNGYHTLNTATAAMSAGERAKGRPRKITGPIAGAMPNKDATEGWIFHSDWDGRFEGVWGDSKDGKVLAHPYTEKTDGGAVAVTYRIPQDGKYKVTAKVTDLNVVTGNAQFTGITCILDLVDAGDGNALAGLVKALKSEKCGDGAGPASVEMVVPGVEAKKGQLIRLAIDPNKWWGGDMTWIESFRIEKQP